MGDFQKRLYKLIDNYGSRLRKTIFDFWNDEKLDLIKKSDKKITSQNLETKETLNSNLAKITNIPHEDDKNLYMSHISKILSQANKITLPSPPPDTYMGDLTIYSDEEIIELAKTLELIIDLAPTAIPELRDLSPLEVFKYQISQFGWNIIQKGCEFSKGLLEKVKY